MTSLAQPAVAEASTDAEQADAPGRAPPEPDVETGLDEEFLAPPSAVPLDAAGLIRLIAPMLGLDPARIAVTPGPPAARPGAISLGADLERGVVAHELAHVAQHANRRRPSAVPNTTAAESEAAGLAVASRTGSPLWAPRATLPAGRVARLNDSSGVAPASPSADEAILEADLDVLVPKSRAAELSRVKDAASSSFTTTGEAIDVLLRILETLDFVTARALVHALDPPARVRLAHFSDDNHREHPLAAAAVLASLSPDDYATFAAEPFSRLRKSLNALNASNLSATQLRALLGALRNVPKSVLVELERGDRREAWRALVGTPAPVGSSVDELKEADDRELRRMRAADADLANGMAADLAPILTSGDEDKVRQALDKLQPLTENAAEETAPQPKQPSKLAALDAPLPAAVKSATDAPPTTTPAKQEKTGTNAPPTPSETLRAVVAELDQTKMVDYLVTGLPEKERYLGDRSRTLQRVLSARAPARTLPKIESLLSYGLFDWAITDSDARFAYFLVRTLPIAEQDAWRVRDAGKWFRRLEENLPEDMVSSGDYTGVGSEYVVGDPKAPAADAAKVQTLYTAYREDWDKHHDGAAARELERKLLGLDPLTATPDSKAENVSTRTQIARRLDTVGIVDELYDRLPDDHVLNAVTRHEIYDLALMRDPVKVVTKVVKLITTGFTNWWVSAREAWVAVQLLRSLPLDVRDAFRLSDTDRWQHMLDSMTDEMRALWVSDPNFGRGSLPDTATLEKRLQDPTLWTDAKASELRAVVDLLRADDDDAWVFKQSQVREAYKSDSVAIRKMVSDFQLYDPTAAPPRTEFKPQAPHARLGIVEFFRFIDEQLPLSVEWIFGLLYDWLIVDRISISHASIEVTNFDLTSAQSRSHGDLMGGHFTDPPLPARPVDKSTPPKAPPNVVEYAVLDPAGPVRISIPELQLDRLSLGRPGASVRTGRTVIRGLKIKADFSDRHYRKPIGADIHADDADVDDAVVADPAVLPGSPWAISHLHVNPLDLKAGAKGTEDLDKELPREGQSIPIPLFGPIWDALTNVVALKGGIPGDYTLIDWALLAPTWNWNLAASEALTLPLNKAFTTPKPLDYVWGYFSDGKLRPPRSIADRAKDAMAMLQSLSVSFDKLQIDGLSIGSGQQVHSLALMDVHAGLATSRPAYLRLLIESLKRTLPTLNPGPPRDAVQKRIDDAQRELDGDPQHGKPGLTQLEDELQKLEAKDRWIPGSLSDDERKRLAELSDMLRRDTGVVLDIRKVEIGELSGKVVAKGIDVGAIHLDGKAPLSKGAYLDDETLAERFRAGGPAGPTGAAIAKEGDLHLTIAGASVVKGPGDAPAIRILADKVPTSTELETRVNALPPNVDPAIRKRLETALAASKKIDDLRASDPTGTIVQTQDAISSQTDIVRANLGYEADSVSLGLIDGHLEPNGTISATVHGTDVKGIRGDGWAMQRFTGDVTVGVGDLGKLGDVREASAQTAMDSLKGHFGLDKTTATGFSTEKGDVVASVGIDGLHGDVRKTADGYSFTDVWATRVAIGGVNVGVPGGRVTAQGAVVEGLALAAELHVDADGKLQSGTVGRLNINKLTADHIVYDADKTSDGATMHVEVKSGSLGDIRGHGLSYAKDSDGSSLITGAVTVGGAEKLNYAVVMSALDSGTKTLKTTTITGTAEGGTMLPAAKDPGATLPSEPATGGAPPIIDAGVVFAKDGYSVDLSLANLKLLDTVIRTPDGNLVIRQATAGGKVGVTGTGVTTDLDFTDIVVSHVSWKSGTAQITSDGTMTLQKLHLVARMLDPEPTSADPQAKLGGLRIDDLDITELNANSLRYHDPPLDLSLGRADATGPGKLHAKRIQLTGFFVPYKPGTKEFGKTVSGHIGVTALDADFHGVNILTEGLSVSGGLNAKTLAVDIFEHDTMVIRATGVSGDVSADMAAVHAHATISNLDTGAVTMTPDAILIGGPGAPGLHFDLLHLDELTIDSTDSPKLPFLLIMKQPGEDPNAKGGGAVDLIDVSLSARIEKWRPDEKHDKDQPLKRIVVDKLVIERIEAEGLSVWFPGYGALVRVPTQEEYKGTDPLPPRAFIRHVELAGGDTAKVFEYVPGEKGHILGKVTAQELAIPQLQANVKDAFHGTVDLHTDQASASFMQNGDTVIDFANPLAKLKDPAWLNRPDRKLVIKQLGAAEAKIELTAAPLKVTVKNASLKGARYEEDGVLVEVEDATVPGQSEFTPTTGSIPKVEIKDAHLHLDLLKLLAGSIDSGGKSSIPLDQESIDRLMKSLQGRLTVTVYLVKAGIKTYSPQDISIPAIVHFTDGKIDFQQLQTDVQGKLKAKTASEPDNPSSLINWAASKPEFVMDGGDLVFQLHIADVTVATSDPTGQTVATATIPVTTEIARWHLATDELKEARDLHQLRLARAIHPVAESDEGKSEAEKAVEQQATADLVASIELRDIDADLSVRSTQDIPLNIDSPTVRGLIVLAPAAIIGLRATGGIEAWKQPKSRAKLPGVGGLRAVSIDSVGIKSTAFVIKDSTKVETGKITVSNVHDASVEIKGVYPPGLKTIDATIGKAIAEDIKWDLAYKPPPK